MILRQLFRITLCNTVRCSVYFSFSKRRPLNQNYYKLLEVPSNATQQEIKRNYLTIIKKYHPDVSTNPSQEFIKKINEAYNILSDPQQRKKYDEAQNIDAAGIKQQNSSETAQQSYSSSNFNQKDQQEQTPEKIPFSRVLILMFLTGMIITTFMMLVRGEFSENNKKLPANIQPKFGVNVPYTQKQQFDQQLKQNLCRVGRL